MLELIGDHGQIQIDVLSVQLKRDADYGVMRWKVAVRSYDMSGEYDEIYIWPDHYENFLQQLTLPEQSRQGTASLISMNPGELEFTVRSYDRLGHMFIEGQLGRTRYIGLDREMFFQKLMFAFEIDPSILLELVPGFSTIKTWV